MALLEGPPVIAEDLLEGVFVDPLSVMCHGRWLYHTLPLGSTCLPSLPCAPPWSLERGTQGQHKKEILIRLNYKDAQGFLIAALKGDVRSSGRRLEAASGLQVTIKRAY